MRQLQQVVTTLLLSLFLLASPAGAQQDVYKCPTCNQYHPVRSAPVVQARPTVSDGLAMLNAQRARRGLRPYAFDPELQRAAEHKATIAANRRIRGHIGGSLYGARREGVGWNNSGRFNSCFAYDRRGGRAGAAIVRRGNQYYCCLLVR